MPILLSVARQRRRFPAIAPVIMAAFLQACMAWQVEPVAPKTFQLHPAPQSVRVTLADGGRLVLRNPVLRGDSLIGYSVAGDTGQSMTGTARVVGPAPAVADTGSRVAFAMHDIRAVEVFKTDAVAMALFAGVLMMVAVVALAAGLSDWGPSGPIGGFGP